MKLYEAMKMTENDWDTYDTVYDACVTVCYIDEEDEQTDDYYKFCTEIIKKVEVEKIIPTSHIVCNWTKLITDNMDKFKDFTEKYWNNQYEDDEDEFIYQWINEIHYYLAGYVNEDFYSELVKFVEDLKA